MKTIKASELKKKLDKILLIDVREPAEHRAEYIHPSSLIPLNEIDTRKLPSTKIPLVIYCRSGNRSIEACKKLLAEDSTLDVSSLEGGIVSWIHQGFAIKKSGSQVIPLDRQTQIAAGLIAFSGTALGALLNPLYYVIPGFIGLGLIFAGITGWCGMAKLLAKMPWNK